MFFETKVKSFLSSFQLFSETPLLDGKIVAQEALRDLALALKLHSLFHLLAYNRVLKGTEGGGLVRTPSIGEFVADALRRNDLPNIDVRVRTQSGDEVRLSIMHVI